MKRALDENDHRQMNSWTILQSWANEWTKMQLLANEWIYEQWNWMKTQTKKWNAKNECKKKMNRKNNMEMSLLYYEKYSKRVKAWMKMQWLTENEWKCFTIYTFTCTYFKSKNESVKEKNVMIEWMRLTNVGIARAHR